MRAGSHAASGAPVTETTPSGQFALLRDGRQVLVQPWT
jgi:hypothetical protein